MLGQKEEHVTLKVVKGKKLRIQRHKPLSRWRANGKTVRSKFPTTSRSFEFVNSYPSDESLKTLCSLRLRNMITGLADLGAIQFGDFILASGQHSPLYVDLRLLVSEPKLMKVAAGEIARKLNSLECDRIAGIPYAALPIGAAVSLTSGKPLIYNRKENKRHGLGKVMEGLWNPGDRVVIIEDVITTGGSICKSVDLFRKEGLRISDAVVLLDREQGGVENLERKDVKVHSIMTLRKTMELLREEERIPKEVDLDLVGHKHT